MCNMYVYPGKDYLYLGFLLVKKKLCKPVKTHRFSCIHMSAAHIWAPNDEKQLRRTRKEVVMKKLHTYVLKQWPFYLFALACMFIAIGLAFLVLSYFVSVLIIKHKRGGGI